MARVLLSMWSYRTCLEDETIFDIGYRKNMDLLVEPTKRDNAGSDRRLRAAFDSNDWVPDIVLMNDWLVEFLPTYAGRFHNLLEPPFEAGKIRNQYVGWKFDLGLTKDRKALVALPVDLGVFVMFYRWDLFEKAGLPSQPEEVSSGIRTWEDYLAAAKKLKARTGVAMFESLGAIFDKRIHQNEFPFFDHNDRYIGDQSHIRAAWDTALAAHEAGLISTSNAGYSEKLANGLAGSIIGGRWYTSMFKMYAPQGAGKARVARAPGGDGNQGGSFLGITKRSAYPDEAWKAIVYMTSPEAQIRQSVKYYTCAATAPNLWETYGAFVPDPYFGGQVINAVFHDAVAAITGVHQTALDNRIRGTLSYWLHRAAAAEISSDAAWNEGQKQATEIAHG